MFPNSRLRLLMMHSSVLLRWKPAAVPVLQQPSVLSIRPVVVLLLLLATSDPTMLGALLPTSTIPHRPQLLPKTPANNSRVLPSLPRNYQGATTRAPAAAARSSRTATAETSNISL